MIPHSRPGQSAAFILGPDGPVAQLLQDYESRPGQISMTIAVERALTEGQSLLVEAGTGIGKTLAYLIPAIQSGLKITISTGTKNLQEQLFYKDIPFVKEALSMDFDAVYVKGRNNYLCLSRYFALFGQQLPLFTEYSRERLEMLSQWANTTETGEYIELIDFDENDPLWREICSTSDTCSGARCPYVGRCFVFLSRRRAKKADIIIINHHLFFADLAIKDVSNVEILPEPDAIIFDEAHHLEAVATQFFGLSVGIGRVTALLREAKRLLSIEGILGERAQAMITDVRKAAFAFLTNLTPDNQRTEITPDMLSEQDWKRYHHFDDELHKLKEIAAEIAVHQEDALMIRSRLAELSTDLAEILTETQVQKHVYWIESEGRSATLKRAPVEVAPLLQEALLSRFDTLVFTSATLTVGHSFSYIKQRLGISFELSEHIIPSTFDYQQQALLYVPRHFPDPRSPEFSPRCIQEIDHLIRLCEGGVFVLFTSYAHLVTIYEAVAPTLPFTVYRQGTKPRSILLEEFKTSTNAVLFATQSFWEGVDVPGLALRCVIIDKLPFSSPSDPLHNARIRLITEKRGNAFMDYQVPLAVMKLRQGFGRLIRSQQDRGLVAILDSRLWTKGYGKKFFASLPEMTRCTELAEVEHHWYKLHQ